MDSRKILRIKWKSLGDDINCYEKLKFNSKSRKARYGKYR